MKKLTILLTILLVNMLSLSNYGHSCEDKNCPEEFCPPKTQKKNAHHQPETGDHKPCPMPSKKEAHHSGMGGHEAPCHTDTGCHNKDSQQLKAFHLTNSSKTSPVDRVTAPLKTGDSLTRSGIVFNRISLSPNFKSRSLYLSHNSFRC